MIRSNKTFSSPLCGRPRFFSSIGLLQLLNGTLELAKSISFCKLLSYCFGVWVGGKVWGLLVDHLAGVIPPIVSTTGNPM